MNKLLHIFRDKLFFAKLLPFAFVLLSSITVSAQTVISITKTASDPNSATTSLTWDIVFSQSTVGVTTSNFILPITGSITLGPQNITGSGSTWSYTAAIVATTDGSVGLDFDNNSGLTPSIAAPFVGEIYTIDATPPRIASITRNTPVGATTNANNLIFEIVFDSPVTDVLAADFQLATTMTASGTIGAVTGSGDTYQVLISAVTGDGDINLDLTGGYTINDVPGNAMINSTSLGADETYAIDNSPPASPVVVSIANDNGTSGSDEITNDNTITITGTAEANASVEVFIDAGSIGSTTANGSGDWTFDHTGTTLANNTYLLSAEATDVAGNTSPTSGNLPITILNTTLNTPVVISISVDTGISPSDEVTSDKTLLINGTSDNNASVRVYIDGGLIGTTLADGAGNWTFDHTGTVLADNTYAITARAFDVPGNTSSLSAGLPITVDQGNPAAPIVTSITTDTGISLTDEITNDNTLLFLGTAEAGATVEVFIDGGSIGTVTANGGGSWSFDHTATPLAAASYSITARATDVAGNTGASSSPLAITIDQVAPSFTSSFVTNVSKNQIVASFNENITLSNANGFSLTSTGAGPIMNPVSGSGTSTLTFTLTGNVVSGEALTLSYDGTGSAIDAAGNGLTIFGPTLITNQVAPLITNAEVQNASATQIVLTFDSNITTTTGAGFSVAGAIPPIFVNASPVGGSGTSIITINLNRAVKDTDIITLSYSSGSGSAANTAPVPIDLASFGGFTITNNVVAFPEPTNHVTGFTATAASTTSINLTWTENNGAQPPEFYLIVGKDLTQGGSYASVSDGVPVADDSNWSNGNFAINLPVGTSSQLISSLISGHDYEFSIYPYTNVSTSINYKTDGTIPLDNALISVGATTLISGGTGVSSFDSFQDTKAEAIAGTSNFDFVIDDDGASNGIDTAPTLINQITINRDAADQTGTWLDAIAGVVLEDNGSGTLNSEDNPANFTIGTNSIIISGIPSSNASDLGYVADNSSKTYSVKIWLRTDMAANGLEIDNKKLVFNVTNGDIVVETVTPPLSSLIAASSANSGASNNSVDVTADRLYWLSAGPINTPGDNFTVVVQATDVNFNRDFDASGDVHTTASTKPAGSHVDPNDPFHNNLVAGQFTRSNVHVSDVGTYVLESTLSGLLSGQSGSLIFGAANALSDITITGFNPPDNIDYLPYEGVPIAPDGSGGIKVAEFQIRDGGSSAPDADGASTELTDISFLLSNTANISEVGIYDGSTIVATQPGSASPVVFSGLAINAPDNGSAIFSLYVSFNSTVVDNDNFQFQISAATANGSTFTAADAGGAASPLAGDDNRIEVAATELRFVQNATNILLNNIMAPAVTIEATDANGSRDLDRDTEVVSLTSTGTLTGTPLTVMLADGFGTFPAIQHTDKGTNFELTAALASHTSAVSSQFDITVSNETILDATAFVPPSNIPYENFQEANINGDGVGDLKIGEFIISEGGLDLVDGDGVATILTSIEFGVTNFENIRSIGLYDQFGVELGEQPATATTTFSGLSYVTPEGLTRTLQLFVSYNSIVDDNEQSIFTVTNATVSSQSSDIASFNSATPGTADINRIEVTATKLDFTTNPEAIIFYDADLVSTPVIEARDINNNIDADFTGPLTITNTAGLLMTNGTNADLNYSNGVITFNAGFQYTVGGAHGANGTLTASDGAITNAVSTAVTVNYSGLSDIIEVTGFSHESNINYTIYQENTNIVNSGSSLLMEEFRLRDGGASSPDADGTPTVVNEITLQIGNWQNLRRIELYNAGGTTALPSTGINEQAVGGEFITFTGLSLSSPDDGTVNFTVRVSFHGDDYPTPASDADRDPGAVDDNEAITFAITNTVENAFSSQLEFANAGGASSALSGDQNRIEVTADRVIFTTDINSDPSTFSNIFPGLVIKAKDIYYSTDVDHTGAVGNISTQNFTPVNPLDFELLGSSVTNLPGNFTAGVYDFSVEVPTLQYITDGSNGEMTIAASGLTAGVSQTHSVFASEESVLTHDPSTTQMFIPYKDYVTIEDPAPYSLGEFTVRDGGLDGVDADGGNTVLSDLTISITNASNLADIALYDAGGTLIPGSVQTAPLTSPITWSGLTITAPDDGITTFTVRAFFESTVTDNQAIDIQVLTVLEGGGSKFEFSDGADGTGGAQTTIGDNIINVQADRLAITSATLDSEQGISIPITPTQPQVSAIDEVGNLDLDFNIAATISSGVTMAGIPPVFVNGILNFPTFTYTGTGDGTLTINATGVTGTTSNSVDVIHTTFTTLDQGAAGPVTALNNGIEALPTIVAGGTNKAILGFELSAQQATTNEPLLQDITVRFGNPIAASLTNIRLVRSVDNMYADPEISINNTNTIIGTDFVTFEGVNVSLTGTKLFYFVVADILETANFETKKITPVVIADSSPIFLADEDVILSVGSIDASIAGRTYGFDDINKPVVYDNELTVGVIDGLTPLNGSESFSKDGIISIQFNEVVLPLDSIISIYSLATDTLVSVLKLNPLLDPLFNVDPLLNNADSTIFYFDPNAPIAGAPLQGDTDYYINIVEGDTLLQVGYIDKSKNSFEGILSTNEWVFKTTDNVPPIFAFTGVANVIDIGFDLRVALDEAGIVNYIVVDPGVDSGTPLASEIRAGTFGTPLAMGVMTILQGDDIHYESIFDDTFTPGSNFRVWLVGEDLVPNLMIDADVISIDGSFAAPFPPNTGVIVQNTPLNAPIDVCIGEFQNIFAPISIIETENNDFGTGLGQDINFILPSEFQYKTDNVTVTGQGGDISGVSFSFINNSILSITFDINSTGSRDKLVIGGIEIKSLGTVSTTGTITRLGGSAIPSILDGDVLVQLNTVQIPQVSFATDPNTTAIGDENQTILLIPDLTPLDKGNRLFSGPGVFGESIFVGAAGLGTHTYTFNYTDEKGCVSDFSLTRTLFDSNKAIIGLDRSYCTDDAITTIPFDGRAPESLLVDLKVEVAPDQISNATPPIDAIDPFLTDVTASLLASGGDYLFDPGIFKFLENYTKFDNEIALTSEGGLLGELLFTSVYQNQQNTTLFDTLQQRVKIYFSPTAEITIGGYGTIGENIFDTLNIAPTNAVVPALEFCEDEANIGLVGSSPNGFFAISIVSLGIIDSINFPGLTDLGDGKAFIDPQTMVDNSVFSFGELDIKFIIDSPESGCRSVVSQTIRINPTPRANFILPAIICEDTPLIFTDITGLLPADSVLIDNTTTNAVYHPIATWDWGFNDAEATAGNPNDAFIATPVHRYEKPGLYDVSLAIVDSAGCSADITIQQVVGGLPTAAPGTIGFDIRGTSLSDTITFQNTAVVVSSSANLDHNIDSVYFYVDGDSLIDISGTDGDPTQQNQIIYPFTGYSSAGLYNASLVAVSTIGCRTTFNRTIAILDNELISAADSTYSQTFESGSGGWIPLSQVDNIGNLSGANSWALGTPTTNKAIQPGDDQGTEVWITGLDSSYASAERSYIYSPVFNIDSLDRPMIQFDIFNDLEEQDGVLFEFSTDNRNIMDPNKTWTALGAKDEGIEWFNNVGLAGSPGDDITGLGWGKNLSITSTWVNAKHDLDTVNNKSRVVFRLSLGAIASTKLRGGFAFDNVIIGNRTRTVLLENFTSMVGSTENEIENTKIQKLVDSPSGAEVVLITYHTSFDGDELLNEDNPSEPSARALYYGISENPRVAIDGATNPKGTNSTNLPYSEWGKLYYSARTLQIAPFSIQLSANRNANGQLDVNTTITATTNETTGNFTVHVVVVEKSILPAELNISLIPSGETVFNNTMRKMLPDAAGTQFTGGLANGSSETLNLTWNPTNVTDLSTSDIEAGRLEIVVFVQDEDSRDVMQATKVNLTEDIVLGIDDEFSNTDVAVYPNPADRQLSVRLANRLTEDVTAIVFDNTGKQVEQIKLRIGQDLIELNTVNYQPGIYMFTVPGYTGAVVKRFIINHR